MIIDNKELIISPASFDDAIDLRDAIEEALKKSNIHIDVDSVDLDDLEKSKVEPETLTSIINSVLSIDSSKKVRECLFKCAQTAVFNKEKVNKDLFEKLENRQYYYQIMFQVAFDNIAPFFEGLFSKFKAMDLIKKIKDIQKLK